MLVVLMLILALTRIDNVAIGLLLQDIKGDLRLTDTQLGLVTGLAFTVFHAVAGLPLARWADRGDRVRIVALCTAAWAAATAAFGLVTSFAQVLAIRIAAGVGEAGCMPSALSLISDRYKADDRPRAIGVFMLGIPLASLFGAIFIGQVSERWGWRAAFLSLGIPGLILAVLVLLLLRDPRRAAAAGGGRAAAEPRVPLGAVASEMWRNRPFQHIVLCFALTGFFASGIQLWQPAFFLRSHDMGTGELGIWLGVAYGLGGLAGTYLGAELVSRFARGDEARQLKVLAGLYAALCFVKASIYLVPHKEAALVLTVAAVVAGAMGNAPIYAALQNVVPGRMRATATACVLFFNSLVGLGLGPLMVGVISDRLQPAWGDEALRFAILAMCPGYLWAAWHLWRAGVGLRRKASGSPDGGGPAGMDPGGGPAPA